MSLPITDPDPKIALDSTSAAVWADPGQPAPRTSLNFRSWRANQGAVSYTLSLVCM